MFTLDARMKALILMLDDNYVKLEPTPMLSDFALKMIHNVAEDVRLSKGRPELVVGELVQ